MNLPGTTGASRDPPPQPSRRHSIIFLHAPPPLLYPRLASASPSPPRPPQVARPARRPSTSQGIFRHLFRQLLSSASRFLSRVAVVVRFIAAHNSAKDDRPSWRLYDSYKVNLHNVATSSRVFATVSVLTIIPEVQNRFNISLLRIRGSSTVSLPLTAIFQVDLG